MRYHVLCCDYDGTIAHHGKVSDETARALERVRDSGRRLMLVTGRELDDLQTVFERLDLFDYVVAENGALLYRPSTREERLLAEPPPARFVEALRARRVSPLSVGRVIVATWEPNETTVLEAIRDLGLESQVIFNKGAVMVLPPGVNKASGLAAALEAMNLSAHNAVGVGDAENDHAFLSVCECGVAVSNALPGLMAEVDFVTAGDHGQGVQELIDELLADDLRSREPKLARHRIVLGEDDQGQDIWLKPYGDSMLIVGTSGSGKSTVATGLLERLAHLRYTYCVIDPEGDYDALEEAVIVGTADHAPSVDEVLQVICRPDTSVVVNLIALPFADRPAYFQSLLARINDLRARIGRPHWLVVDETHHVLPADAPPQPESSSAGLESGLMISVHPRLIARPALDSVDTLIAVGNEPDAMLREFAEAVGKRTPPAAGLSLQSGEALVWRPAQEQAPRRVHVAASQTERRRHVRKYSEGELPEDRSFYFRGPDGRLKLRAQNLVLFMQLADGVDDETWTYHLRRGDISRWIEQGIKDQALAGEVRKVEQRAGIDPQATRSAVREAIERSYTLPAPER